MDHSDLRQSGDISIQVATLMACEIGSWGKHEVSNHTRILNSFQGRTCRWRYSLYMPCCDCSTLLLFSPLRTTEIDTVLGAFAAPNLGR